MQTFYKISFAVGLLCFLGCEDSLQLNPVEQSNTLTNSLTISLYDPADAVMTGTYEFTLNGPKEIRSIESNPTLKLENLPAGEYSISIVKPGHVSFRKQIRINDLPEKSTEQRYRIEVPLAKKGNLFKLQQNEGVTVSFPSGSVVSANNPFAISKGISRYDDVRITVSPCSLAEGDCQGDLRLSASIVPLHAEFIAEAVSSNKIGLFLLDLESDKVYRFSKPLSVDFPLALKNEELKSLEYEMEKVILNPNTGTFNFTGQTIPVLVNADGSKGTVKLPEANSDWVFSVKVKLETTVLPLGYASLIKSKKPGTEVVANVSLNKEIDSALSQLLGLNQGQYYIKEAKNVTPTPDKIAEISFNMLNRQFILRHPISNAPIFSTDLPIYPLTFKTVISVPHDSGGGG